MALQENFQEPAAEFESPEDVPSKQSVSSLTELSSENSSGCCECSICLDSATEPVVTLCGHLYCWPCIYKWIHLHESDNQPKCPVCKANISDSSLVPLYGRGNYSSDQPESKKVDPVIPSRPSANQQIYPFGNYASLPATERSLTSHAFSPTVGVFGEMFLAMMFRSGDHAGLYGAAAYRNSYPAMATSNGSPRMRRQVMQVEKSLNRLTIFLFCCFISCLLLF